MLTSKPVVIRIPGDFWDSHIYSGRLFVFGADKSLLKLDWRSLIATHQDFETLNIAAHGIMVDAGFFYSEEAKLFLSDEVVLERVRSCFSNIQGLAVDVNVSALEKVSQTDSPFPNLHTDCEIYHHKIYGGMPEGLYLATSTKDEGASKLWDAGVYGLRASDNYGSVAIAAGGEGLWEFSIKNSRLASDALSPKITSNNFCTACDWGDQSIYAWSASAEGFLASYYMQRSRGERTPHRVFDRTIKASEIHEGTTTFWGSHGRAYALSDDGDLDVLDYDSKAVAKSKSKTESSPSVFAAVPVQPLRRRDKRTLSSQIPSAKRRPVAVATAPFGTVLQFGNQLHVMRSDGEQDIISGDIVTWRVFPRSLNYANQLHVVFDDRLEIYAFLHDYFVDQQSKEFGYSV
jgi:hypothetical protein